ncbi:phosphoribosyl-AMP cyclohydrolase [Tsuneonella sp. YG55]|uniref:Phosphoribosyl-AMP cyclohydrolase n=1 Tax=Tsuneonella litorea TaxID=2976475 RepID=A0A9X2W0K1_9SPHN|nr:phosphoribosyl-AMP cyclohydrolase [Tsuneonella litorea]MCT2557695.1 phosphoribosyl-AMP cyclohydrolase [Tsuneonella litorea]
MKTTYLLAPIAAGLALAAAPVQAKHHEGGHPAAQAATYAPITVAEVEAAQQAWCNALVAISTEADTKVLPADKALAGQVIDSTYAYGMGPVLFKPTLAAAPQTFRPTRDGALSYFVGDDATYPNDGGFALKHWRSCESENAGILITGNSAMSMGNVSMWDDKGNLTKVDKTWGYVRDGKGKLRIVLHHSSLPYAAS